MRVTTRSYRGGSDFFLLSDFLTNTYVLGGRYPNWEESRWQYMHSHPASDAALADRIRIWEDAGQVVGFVTYEGCRGERGLGQVFPQVAPTHRHLLPEMIEYAEKQLGIVTEQGTVRIAIYAPDFDQELESMLEAHGYEKEAAKAQWTSLFSMPQSFPEIRLPEGYNLQSLADENDLRKIHRVLWRGFNHPGEPDEDVACRKQMQTSPNFRHELTIVVKAPKGDYASFCGMWFEPVTKMAYVEPVATDPSYRRMGLGRAAVLEGIRRCAELGATHAIVGSDQEFYLSFGFDKAFAKYPWIKEFVRS